LFPKTALPDGLYNGDTVCLLWGRKWILKQYLDEFSYKVNPHLRLHLNDFKSTVLMLMASVYSTVSPQFHFPQEALNVDFTSCVFNCVVQQGVMICSVDAKE
jgi:hypothetical protein